MSGPLKEIDNVEGKIKERLFGAVDDAPKETLLKIINESFEKLPEIVKKDLTEKEKINDPQFQTDVLKALIEKYKVEFGDMHERVTKLNAFLTTLDATSGGRRRTRRRKRSSRRRRKSH